MVCLGFFKINITYLRNDCDITGHLLWLVEIWLEKLSENELSWGGRYNTVLVINVKAVR